ncbi:MAG: helix-turn-helix transcriptional regulator [Fimbriimonadaceae bacterium]|nr:helix-turn-helix transcriptional regulator [Fimbriimonadaceae bacterium]
MLAQGLPMHYHEIAPVGGLSGSVASFWEFTAGADLPQGYMHVIPVDGCVSIAYIPRNPRFQGCAIVGPRLTSLRVPICAGDRFWGVRLLPGAARSIVGVSGRELFERHLPLREVAAALDQELYPAFVNAKDFEQIPSVTGKILEAHLKSHRPPDRNVARGISEILRSHGQSKIADICAIVGFSERQFLRLFRTEVGLSPKQFARICRLRAAAIDAVDGVSPSWGQIANEHGYADQSHLVREFTNFFGLTPTEFEKHCIEHISHGDIRRDV